ncbi:MAG TPA: PAS domain-containing protein, partial [Pyrinomonadaceae bacterium]|nr:PAS domain-containing protein [Pyrinomonadaceae bacterium]
MSNAVKASLWTRLILLTLILFVIWSISLVVAVNRQLNVLVVVSCLLAAAISFLLHRLRRDLLDITEQRQSEAALRESHSVLRAVIEGTPDAIFVKDIKGRYVMVNSAFADFLRKSPAEIIGKSDTELYLPETARQFIEDDRKVLSTGETQTFEGVAQGPDITQMYLVTKAVYRDHQGRVIGLIGISHDITERTRA